MWVWQDGQTPMDCALGTSLEILKIRVRTLKEKKVDPHRAHVHSSRGRFMVGRARAIGCVLRARTREKATAQSKK